MYKRQGIFNGEIQNSENEVSQKQSELKDFINNNDIELKEVADAVGIRNIKKVETGYLPNSLPYHVVSTTYEENYLTDDFMDKITLAVNNAPVSYTHLTHSYIAIEAMWRLTCNGCRWRPKHRHKSFE